MQAITLWPEWSWAILNLGKDVENRCWPLPPKLIGVALALHAGRNVGGQPGARAYERGCAALRQMAARAGHDPGPLAEWYTHMRRDLDAQAGAIVAVVRFGRSVRNSASHWAVPHEYHWPIAELFPLPHPVRCRGLQRLWPVPDEVARMIRDQVPNPRGAAAQ